MRHPAFALGAALAAALAGCTRTAPAPEGPLTIAVSFHAAAGDDLGTEEDPLPFDTEPVTFTIDIEVIDVDHERMESFEGPVGLRVRPGQLEEPRTVEIAGGHAEGVAVTFSRAHGPTRIWVEDSERGVASWATGVSPEIHFETPTIAMLQTPDTSADVSPLVGEHVDVQVADRDVLVTWVGPSGFTCIDTTDGVGAYNALYVFNYNRPRDLEQGDRLSALQGTVTEYNSYTELGYPAFSVESSGHELPGPVTLTADDICGGEDTLERYEAALVRIEDVVTAFDSAEDCSDYVQYGQWPVVLLDAECPGGTPVEIGIFNQYTIPSLAYPECEDGAMPPEREFSFLQGILVENHATQADWLLYVRGCEDLPQEARPDDCEQEEAGARYHYSGPRPAPGRSRRVIPGWLPYEIDEM